MLDAKTMTEHLSFMLIPFRLGSALLSILGGLALVLATIGLYGVVSYSAATRTRGDGYPPLARGARRPGGRPGAARWACGWWRSDSSPGCCSPSSGRAWSAGCCSGSQPTDPATFAAVTLLLLLVSAAAALGPALKASRVDPVDTLKAD